MKTVTYTEALRKALSDEMEADDSVFLLGEDLGVYGGAFGVTRGLLERFGAERVIDVPISEASFTGVAVGAALGGCRPVVEIMFMDFITLAVDQLVNQAAKLRYIFGPQSRCPMVLRTPGGGGRSYGPTHSQSLAGLFVQIPGLKVVAPSTPDDAYWMLRASIRDNNPVIFVEHKMLYGTKGSINSRSSGKSGFGKARIAVQGSDITVIAWSWMAVEAEIAAAQLAEEDISVEVIDLRSLNPMDTQTITESAKKTGRVLVVEEGPGTAGTGAETACRISENAGEYLDMPVRRLTSPEIPVPAAASLEKAAIPNRDTIVEAAADLFNLSDS